MANNGYIRSIVDKNTDVFRYGLYTLPGSKNEDPTLLGYTVEIDEENSPLFRDLPDFLEAYKNRSEEFSSRIAVQKEFAQQIVQVMKTQDSVVSEADRTKFIKGHYINTIAGTNLLTKKIHDYGKDKLTFTLHEDITMFSTRLAILYNDLVWSYNAGRVMVPENLTKFVMKIKISEIRNIKSALASADVARALVDNSTCVIYTLWDCHFDFSASAPFGDTMSSAGIDTALPDHASLSFDIYFKSISRVNFTPMVLTAGNVRIDDSKDNLNITTRTVGNSTAGNIGSEGVFTNDRGTNADGTALSADNNNPYQQPQTDANESEYDATGLMPRKETGTANEIDERRKTFSQGNPESPVPDNDTTGATKPQITRYNPVLVDDESGYENYKTYEQQRFNDEQREERSEESDDYMDNIFGANTATPGQQMFGEKDLSTRIRRRLKVTANDALARGLAKLRAERSELVRNFVYDYKKTAGFADDSIVPNNVYYDKRSIAELATKKILADFGFEIGNAIIDLSGF